MARLLALLFLAGAATGGLTLLLPHASSANDGALWSNVTLAFVGAVGLFVFAPKVRPWMLQVIVAVGVLLVTRAVYYSGYAGTFYGLWYVWVGLFAFFAFQRRAAIAHLALVGVTYAWALCAAAAEQLRGALDHDRRHRRDRGHDGRGADRPAPAPSRSGPRARTRALELVSNAAHELGRQTNSEAAATALCEAAIAATTGAQERVAVAAHVRRAGA